MEQERAEQEASGEMARYSGKCRNLTAEQIAAYQAEGRMPSTRFRVPADRIIAFEDKVRDMWNLIPMGLAISLLYVLMVFLRIILPLLSTII